MFGLGVPEVGIILVLVSILAVVLIVLFEIATSKMNLLEKVFWGLAVFVLPVIFAPLYFYKKKDKKV